jgi:uncharacterized protein HemX
MEPEKKSNGALVGLVIILIILIIGGIYIWQSKVKNALEGQQNNQAENLAPADSNELDALEQELNSTDTNIDVDVEAVD